MSKSKTSILKSAMSAPYCGETRFNFLDGDETIMILRAMDEYAEQESAKLFEENAKFSVRIGNLLKENAELLEQRKELLEVAEILFGRIDGHNLTLAEEKKIESAIFKAKGNH